MDNYTKKCDGEFWRLKGDIYIFQYLGYHLQHAGYSNRFPNIFLQLDFINAKIKAAGSRDTIEDLKQYENYIAVEVTESC